MPRIKFKSSWIGVFLIGIMLFSTFAYAVIQSFYPKQPSLPDSNIIDYRLDSRLEEALIQYGVTVITFEYNMGCENCITAKSALEFYANEYRQQLFLEEIRNDALDASRTVFASMYGDRELFGANETGITSALCELMASPPVACVL